MSPISNYLIFLDDQCLWNNLIIILLFSSALTKQNVRKVVSRVIFREILKTWKLWIS